ncbi:MAG: hypothetical protein K2K05_11310, partial [Muribaculaceae bacterium]|nr:hypothetical protein [Muribaculaceae bacterium]
ITTDGGKWISAPVLSLNLSEISDPEIELNFEVNGEPVHVDGVTVPISGDLNAIVGDIKDALQKALDDAFNGTEDQKGVNEQLNDMVSKIAGQVNELLESMQSNIDGTIESVLADIKNRVNGAFDNNTVNKVVNRLDGIISKLNYMMDHANYYLQPVLLYNLNGDYGMVSSSEAMPTVMVLNGNANALAILPTTYTYETVVPTYKKYVAVTKVWKNGDKDKTNLKSIALEANDNTKFNTNMNKVINSNVREIALQLQKGYTYEVFYQAVDYSGYVSGRKYYICVK